MNDSSHVSKPQNSVGEVTFLPSGIKVPLSQADLKMTLLDFAWRNKVKIPTSCGGGGSCGACRIHLPNPEDNIEPRNEIEQSMAEDRGFDENERLSCQISPRPGMVVLMSEGDE